MRLHKKAGLFALLLFALQPLQSLAFSGNANFSKLCEQIREEWITNDSKLENVTHLVCRSTYSPNEKAALPITIGVSECLQRCPGYEISSKHILTQWVGPFVGFLLPALAFVISIPRPIRIPRYERLFGLPLIKSAPWLLAALVLMAVDIILWIFVVFAFAGPLVAGSIHEAFIDHSVLQHAENVRKRDPEAALHAIAFALIGSLEPRKGDLKRKVHAFVVESPRARRKLLSLLSLLPSYGARVGVPITFYLGAFAYALFEANSRLGDNDTSHAVAFGLWYGVVVIVAIVASSVLGVDNPASLEAVFDDDDLFELPVTTNAHNGDSTTTAVKLPARVNSRSYHFHDSPFRTIWIWKRARVMQEWTRKNMVDGFIADKVESSVPRIMSACLASFLVTIPCAGAYSISYYTPQVGLGCRSAIQLIYGISQLVLIVAWWLYYSSHHRITQKEKNQRFSFTSASVYAVTSVTLFAALFSSIGGTIMQLVGVFKNCICKASLKYLLPKKRAGGVVLLSNDTSAHRNNATLWIIVGSIGIGYIALTCIIGWLYQARTRSRCKRILELLEQI
jgi:hypothetical protein